MKFINGIIGSDGLGWVVGQIATTTITIVVYDVYLPKLLGWWSRNHQELCLSPAITALLGAITAHRYLTPKNAKLSVINRRHKEHHDPIYIKRESLT